MLKTNNQGLDQLREAAPPAKEAWEFLDESTQEEGAAAEAAQDIALLRENADAHLTAAIAAQVVHSPEDEAAIQVVLPHLCRCSWCRGTLRETLALCGTEANHPAFALLAEAEDWARWEDAGRQATQSAHQFLRSQGGNIVYADEGAIWEEQPDGTAQRVAEIKTKEAPAR